MARTWLQIQANLQLSPKTIDAYGRGLNDYLNFCAGHQAIPATISREQCAFYVSTEKARPQQCLMFVE